MATFTHALKTCAIYTASYSSLDIFPSVPFAASLVKQYGQALEVAVSEGVVKAMMTLVGAVGCICGICKVEYLLGEEVFKRSPPGNIEIFAVCTFKLMRKFHGYGYGMYVSYVV